MSRHRWHAVRETGTVVRRGGRMVLIRGAHINPAVGLAKAAVVMRDVALLVYAQSIQRSRLCMAEARRSLPCSGGMRGKRMTPGAQRGEARLRL